MKKILSILAIVSIVCFGLKSNCQAQTCTITNFTSTCVKPTAPRQFSISFKITVSGTTATSVTVGTTNGNFFPQANPLSVPVIGNVANVTLTYSEVMPQQTMPVNLTFSNGSNILFKDNSNQQLCSCGSIINCSTAFVTPQVNGSFGNSGNGFIIADYATCGPDSVKSVTATITNVKRRTVCVQNGVTVYSAWVTTTLPPGGTSPATTQTYTPARDYYQKQPQDFHITYVPAAKLNANCKEEYQITVSTKATFKNGCSATATNTITAIRP